MCEHPMYKIQMSHVCKEEYGKDNMCKESIFKGKLHPVCSAQKYSEYSRESGHSDINIWEDFLCGV